MRGQYEDIAERWLTIVLRGPVEWMASCPFCDGASSLQFNIDKGLWVCFRCDTKGNAKSLVKRLGGNYADPIVSTEHLRELMDKLKLRHKRSEEDEPVKTLDERYLMRFQFEHEYWTQVRGYSSDTIKKWGLGYDPLSDRCTIAYRDSEGNLLGVIERRLDDTFPRYLYPKGFFRVGSLFGSWELHSQPVRRVALVEGSTDCITVYDAGRRAVAQYGSSISRLQVKLLRSLGVREVVLFYDYDEAGRKAEIQARTVLDGFILYRVKWDTTKYCWHKKLCGCGEHDWKSIGKCQQKYLCRCGRQHEMDPGKLSHEEIRSMYDNAVLTGRIRDGKAAGFHRGRSGLRNVNGR